MRLVWAHSHSRYRRRKSITPTRNWTIIPHSASPYPCHNDNYAIPSPDEISRITKISGILYFR
jgi:hypothetical protein